MNCGGHSQVKDADDVVKQIVADIKAQVEAMKNETYSTFEAVTYTSQVVAGTNFNIKVNVGDDTFLQVKVFRPLPCNGTELELKDVE